MPIRARGLACLAIVVLASLGLRAHATTVVALDDAALVDASERIVHGKVLERTSSRLDDGRVVTTYRIQVREWLKGEDDGGGAALVFREWGGTLADGSGTWIPGAGSFEVGEEVLVFLAPRGDEGVGFTTGLAQGKFHVRPGPDGAKRASRSLGRLSLVDASGRPVEGADDKDARDLTELKRKVKERVRRRAR